MNKVIFSDVELRRGSQRGSGDLEDVRHPHPMLCATLVMGPADCSLIG